MLHQPSAGFDQPLAQRGQRPALDLVRRRQRAQEAGEVVGQGVQLEPHGVVREPRAGKPRPFDGMLAFLDMLLGGVALVVESQHPLVRQAAVGDDETDSREQLAQMELHFGDHPARLLPTLGPVMEAGVLAHDTVRRPTEVALHQPSDLLVQLRIALYAGRVVTAFGLQQVERRGNGEGSVGAEPLPRDRRPRHC